MKGNGELPLNWAVTKLGILFELEYGKGLTKKDRVESGTYPVYGSNGIVGYHDKYLVEGPVLIVGRKGAAGAISYSSGSCWPIDTTYFVRESECIDIKFSYYLLKSLNLAKHEKSTAIPGLNRNDAYDETVFLPPLNEQKRIVAKIEALFAELEAGVASLKTAQAQLKTYRQALLKYAFTGKLTEQWRAENADNLEDAGRLEDGSTLLQRIRAERQARHEAALAAWAANGKRGQKPRPPKDLPPLTPAELEELPQLPAGWAWVKVGEVFGVYVGATPSRKIQDYWGGDIYWVSSGEVAFCRIRQTKETITELGYTNSSTDIHPIGTVMLGMIGEGKTRGQAAILDIEATHNQNTAAIRVSETDCLPEYLFHYLFMQYEITRRIGSGNNQKALNKERVSEMRFPLSPIAEQRKIIEIIDEKLSEVDQLEQTITTALQQAEALRQSILKQAFSGQLVPQDPADEPAAVLLARIRAAKP
jgi:type I restriction enzyme, S subunit